MTSPAVSAPKHTRSSDAWLDLAKLASYNTDQDIGPRARRGKTGYKGWFMSKLTKILLIVGVVAVAGGAIFLMTWDIPAPSEKVTKTLSNDRFPS